MVLPTTLTTPQGTIKTTETLKLYRRQKIAKSEFQVPKGYSKTIDPITQIKQVAKQMQSQGRMPGMGGMPGAMPPMGGAPAGGFGLPPLRPPGAPGAPKK